jgi:hypothetical protein
MTTRRAWIAIGAAAAIVEAAVLARRGQGLGGNVVVRCRGGHLFTTIWLPAASVKALRLGPWRIQWCPVGHHWSLVTPAHVSALSRRERRAAAVHHDLRIP